MTCHRVREPPLHETRPDTEEGTSIGAAAGNNTIITTVGSEEEPVGLLDIDRETDRYSPTQAA